MKNNKQMMVKKIENSPWNQIIRGFVFRGEENVSGPVDYGIMKGFILKQFDDLSGEEFWNIRQNYR